MLKHHWLAAALAVVPLAAMAQTGKQDPADPHAAAEPLHYESAFAGYRPAQEPETSPEKHWRTANDEVGGLATGSHAQAAAAAPSGTVSAVQGHEHDSHSHGGHHH